MIRVLLVVALLFVTRCGMHPVFAQDGSAPLAQWAFSGRQPQNKHLLPDGSIHLESISAVKESPMIRIAVSILLLACLAFAQEAQPSTQPTSQEAACPAPAPGTEITITIAWQGVTVPIRMPAEANSILNKFSAELCSKYSKDITGVLTGKKDSELPQTLWSINLIVETYLDLVKRIVDRDPKRYAPDSIKALMAEAEQKATAVQKAKEEASQSALQVVSQ